MSHYEIFKPKKEELDELYTCDKADDFVYDDERDILMFCLQNDGYTQVRTLNVMLTLLRKHLEWQVNNDIKSDFEDHEDFAFSGWEFARPTEVDIDEIYQQELTQFSILAFVVKTPDYFQNRDTFEEKVQAINEQLDYFKESMITNYKHSLCEKFKDSNITDKDE